MCPLQGGASPRHLWDGITWIGTVEWAFPRSGFTRMMVVKPVRIHILNVLIGSTIVQEGRVANRYLCLFIGEAARTSSLWVGEAV